MSEGPELPEVSASDIHDKRLNRSVAITVVIISVSMALTNIKDGNIVQNMAAAQSHQLDLWNEYQAARLKQHMQEIALANGGPAAEHARSEIARYEQKSGVLKQQAEAAQVDYDRNNYRDDQFDLSDGLASIALACAAVAALVELWALLWFAWGAGALSLLFAVAGFAQLPLHPDMLISWLT